MRRFIQILRYIFSKNYRAFLKALRQDVTFTKLREEVFLKDASYSEMLKNGY